MGTVNLNVVAPAGGVVISLSSSNVSVASVPQQVTVGAGSVSASFTITTVSSMTTNMATITATYLTSTKSVSLGVTAVISTGQTVTGNWQASFTSTLFSVTGNAYGFFNQSGSSTVANLHFDGSPCFSSSSSTGTVIGTSVQFTAVENGQTALFTGSLSALGNSMQGTYTVSGGCANGDRGAWSAVMIPVGQCVAAPIGMVSWWRGEGNANDDTGRNPGTLFGGVSFVPGKVNEAFDLDGSTGYINVLDSASLESITAQESVEVWVNPVTAPAAAGWEYIYSRRQPLTSESFSVYILQTGALGIIVRTTSSTTTTGSKFESAPGAIAFGQFQHVAATANSGSGVVTAYINGAAVPLTATFGPSTFSGSLSSVNQLYIGRREDINVGEGVGGAAYFDGLIDETTLYATDLDQAQVQFIFHAGNAGKCPIN